MISAESILILMPVFEDRASARRLFFDIAQYCHPAPLLLAVEDGSVSEILQASDLLEAGLEGKILHLTRNVGHQRAIAAGLTFIALNHTDYTLVVMDSDGEDSPASIPLLLEALSQGGCDVVVAKRRQRYEGWRFQAFYAIYRRVFSALTGRSIRFGNFMAMTEKSVRRLSVMQETWLHFPATVLLSRLRRKSVPINRGQRHFGVSRMNLVSLMLHGMRSVMVFADDVLVRIGLSCVTLIVVATLLLGLTFFLKIAGLATPGWFTIASGILMILLTQAGILSFITLMISGTVKSSVPIQRTDLDFIIDRVEEARRPEPTNA